MITIKMNTKLFKEVKKNWFTMLLSIVFCHDMSNEGTTCTIYTSRVSVPTLSIDVSQSTYPFLQTSEVQSEVNKFLEDLSKSRSLENYFQDNWTLIYQVENRCDGITDGKGINLKRKQIDTIIMLQVSNDGQGWACDKQDPSKYNFEFDLKDLMKQWDRFEISGYDDVEKHIVYIVGGGESEFIKIYFNQTKKIYQFEYHSEDPG